MPCNRNLATAAAPSVLLMYVIVLIPLAIASRVNKPVAPRAAFERGKGLILSTAFVDAAQAIASHWAVPVVVCFHATRRVVGEFAHYPNPFGRAIGRIDVNRRTQ